MVSLDWGVCSGLDHEDLEDKSGGVCELEKKHAPNVLSSTIYNSQDMEATQVPFNR